MEQTKKLLARPVEEGTNVLSETVIIFEEFKALFEVWSWEGISATSLVYLKDDAMKFNKEELIDSLFRQMQMPRDPKLTYKEFGEYVFLNFNFEIG